VSRSDSPSLYQLLDPEVLADPYPLYARLRSDDPVQWDPYLHAWVVTRYGDVAEVLRSFNANRTPPPEKLYALGMGEFTPIAKVMVKQMLFLDPPEHGRIRRLATVAFTPRRVEQLRSHIEEIASSLLDEIEGRDSFDVINEFATVLPGIVTTEMLGVPASDHLKLKQWSETFAEMLGNFQHNPGRSGAVLRSLEEMLVYFQDAVRNEAEHPTSGLVHALATAVVDGDSLTEDEVVANLIVTMVGGQETTTNLIGNGLLSLLRNPDQLQTLREDPDLVVSAVEELLRFESPSQHTARLAPEDVELGGKSIAKGQAVIAVMGAANRDPDRFAEPDHLDIERTDNQHLAFGWSSHFCFGAPLARIEGQVAFEALLQRLPNIHLDDAPLEWRPNLGLRGLTKLVVHLT